MKRLKLSALSLVCVLLGTTAPAFAEERPFSANGEAVLMFDSFIGQDTVQHFGLALLRLDVNPYPLIYPEPGEDRRLQVFGMSLLAANGDHLLMDLDVVVDSDTGLATGTVTFIGGSGRFQDATGGADVLFLFDERYRSFAFAIEGTINY